jgi:hypothetical protein
MPSASGLSYNQRIRCRDRVVDALKLALAHKAAVHYTQEIPQRWEGIAKNRRAHLGEFPAHSDCSSFATWALWNGLFLLYRLPDRVNGQNWKAGFTGTMLDRGMRVRDVGSVMRGDCVFYANPTHVAVVVSRTDGPTGKPMVISHGSEKGPHHLPFDYKPVTQIRRYI